MPRKKSASKSNSSGDLNEQREKAFMSVLDDINSKYGTGTILRMDDQPLNFPNIPSGSLGIDILLGIGGFPKGRITEIFGPAGGGKSTIALHAIREAMREAEYQYKKWEETPENERGPEPNKTANVVYIDMESALNKSLAEMIGVDVSKLYLVQPASGEAALDVMEMAINSGVVDIVVLDSVAALVPRAEIEGEMGDSHVGLQARLMNQALRKIGPAINQTKTVAIFINQVREKVGVMFGCFSYGSTVLLEDGSLVSIGKIVNQKLDVKVMSYNSSEDRFEAKPIKEWFKDGVPIDKFDMTDNEIGDLEREYHTLILSYPDNSGKKQLTCTPNHEVLTPKGYVSAMYLALGDDVLTRYERTVFNDDLHHFVLGSTFGDNSIRKEGTHTASFRESHAEKEYEYAKWKSEVLDSVGLLSSFSKDKRNAWNIQSVTEEAFVHYKRQFYTDDMKYKRIKPSYIYELNPFSLAIWYQDDGTRKYDNDSRRYEISMHSIDDEDEIGFAKAFMDHFGLEVSFLRYESQTRIAFSGENAEKFEALITPYMHPSMAHKTRLNNVGECLESLNFSTEKQWVPFKSTVIETHQKNLQGKKAVRYNLEIEDNANYIVSDTIVHNSPETTPGGRGLPFYASVRLRVSRIQNIKEKNEIIGMRVKVEVKKNKMAPPFGITEYDLFFDSGISIENEILDIGADLGIVTKRGAFYYYSPPDSKDEDSVLLGQGRTNAREFLQQNIDIRNYLYEEILKLQLPHLTIGSDDDIENEKPKKAKRQVSLDEDEVLVEEIPEDE